MKIKIKIAISFALLVYFSIALYGCIRTQDYLNGVAVFTGIVLAGNLLKISLSERKVARQNSADVVEKK